MDAMTKFGFGLSFKHFTFLKKKDNQMKTIKFGFALDGGCPKTSMAVIEPLPRIGINNLVLYNVFQKSYNVTAFVAQLKKIVNGPHGKINVMLTLDSAPFSEMTDAKKYYFPVYRLLRTEALVQSSTDPELHPPI